MKRLYYLGHLVLFVLFLITLFLAIQEITGASPSFAKLNYPKPEFMGNEEFDASLQRLDNIDKLRSYCDSIYSVREASPNYSTPEKEYASIAAEAVRKRFYHGLSSYGFGYNYLAYLANPSYLDMYLNAPVRPDDILKYPYGICSQQAVVIIDLLKSKGYQTRKVGFSGKNSAGHFCVEVFYRNSWHYFDTDMEPDVAVLTANDRPSIQYLVEHPDLLKAAYKKLDPAKVDELFPTYFYGKVNEPLARNAGVFQLVTKILSYTLWIFFLLAFIWARRKYVRLSNHRYVRNRRISLSDIQTG